MLVKEETRKLARIVTISDILPIPKADRLEVAVVDGWECVVQKGLYQKGDEALYLEIDAAIALDNPALEGFDTQYLKKTVDEKTGKEWAVIKSVRLRKQLSQGLLLNKSVCFKGRPNIGNVKPGTNLTQALDIMKYVSPAEAKLYNLEEPSSTEDTSFMRRMVAKVRAKLIKGIVIEALLPWPQNHVKSDEERVQNVKELYDDMRRSEEVEISLKANGESVTIYTDVDTKEIGVAQRNYALRVRDVKYTFGESLRLYAADWLRYINRKLSGGRCSTPKWANGYSARCKPLVDFFHASGVADMLKRFNENPLAFMEGKTLTVQGEMIGPDFNGNAEGVNRNQFYIYRAYANGNQRLTPSQTKEIANHLGVPYIPLIQERMRLPEDIREILKLADGPAHWKNNGLREGIVAKGHVTGRSFKIISNKWLETEK